MTDLTDLELDAIINNDVENIMNALQVQRELSATLRPDNGYTRFVRVYQNPNFNEFLSGSKKLNPVDLKLVATLYFHGREVHHTKAMDAAFQMTNTIDSLWWENESSGFVEFVSSVEGCRSTSCGDVMEVDDGWYVVDIVGFTQLFFTHEPRNGRL